MSVLKIKNASGRWVEVDSVLTQGQLKVDTVTKSEDGRSYDLTKYLDCNRFFLFYTESTVRYLFDSAQVDGKAYRLDADADGMNRGFERVFGVTGNMGAIATCETGESGDYTYENGVLTFSANASSLGTSALVIYAE